MQEEIINGNHYLRKFTSLSEMTAFALEDAQWAKHSFDLRTNGNYLNRMDFVGRTFPSLEHLRKAIHSHWPEGQATFERMLGQLQEHRLEPPKSIRRRSIWSEDGGDEVCLDRLKMNQPYWRTTKRDARPGPVNVTILTEMGASTIHTPEQIFWRGVASVVMSHLLEEAGYRVNLFAVDSRNNPYATSKMNSNSIVELKRCEEPLDISTLCNAVSGWCYRTMWFAARTRQNEQLDEFIGAPHSTEHLIPYATPDIQAIVSKNIWSETAAVRWVQQQLEKFKTGEFAQQ